MFEHLDPDRREELHRLAKIGTPEAIQRATELALGLDGDRAFLERCFVSASTAHHEPAPDFKPGSFAFWGRDLVEILHRAGEYATVRGWQLKNTEWQQTVNVFSVRHLTYATRTAIARAEIPFDIKLKAMGLPR